MSFLLSSFYPKTDGFNTFNQKGKQSHTSVDILYAELDIWNQEY